MSIQRSNDLRRYVAGLCAVVVGAGVSSLTESMLPLALGSAAAVLGTAGLVQAIRVRARDRRRHRSVPPRD